MTPLLEITNLNVRFDTADGTVEAVKNASLAIRESECLGVVGESGSGKSQLFLAAFGLLAANGKVSGSEIKFTSTGGTNYTLSLSDNMMLPARYHRLTGSARQPYDGTVDVACGAPRGRTGSVPAPMAEGREAASEA